jgi:hypothetical protein
MLNPGALALNPLSKIQQLLHVGSAQAGPKVAAIL